MSVLIKGMEMPPSCGACRFHATGWCYVYRGSDQPGNTRGDRRPDWCPLVEVQKRETDKKLLEEAGFEL